MAVTHIISTSYLVNVLPIRSSLAITGDVMFSDHELTRVQFVQRWQYPL